MVRAFVAALMLFALTACQSVGETQTAPNTWQLSAAEVSRLGSIAGDDAVLTRAAELTLKNGYSRFTLEDAPAARGGLFIGVVPVVATFSSSPAGSVTNVTSAPIGVAGRSGAVLVRMLRPGDPGYGRAIDAASVLQGSR